MPNTPCIAYMGCSTSLTHAVNVIQSNTLNLRMLAAVWFWIITAFVSRHKLTQKKPRTPKKKTEYLIVDDVAVPIQNEYIIFI